MLLGLLGFVASLTVLWHSMRSVMEVGGACASGGPYEVRQPCPTGVAATTPLSIFAGIASLGVYVVCAWRLGSPSFAWLAWPALFTSLGWNFLEFGVSPPHGEGVSPGWIVCAVVFLIMGLVPLLFAVNRNTLRSFVWGPERPREREGPVRQAVAARIAAPVVRPAAGRKHTTEERVTMLERLSRLHDEGALTDDEFAAAKRTVLEDAT
jgi:hypothetical protein